MIDKAGHVAWAAEAVALFQKHCGTGDEHAIADLICDLGHLADARGFDFLDELERGIGHWYAERHVSDRPSRAGCRGRDYCHAEVVWHLNQLPTIVTRLSCRRAVHGG
jgi:hypothetical protein